MARLAIPILLLVLGNCKAPVSHNAQTIYRDYCVSCHGLSGKGDGPLMNKQSKKAADLSSMHFIKNTSGEKIKNIIYFGIGNSQMPAFANILTESEILALSEKLLTPDFFIRSKLP